LPTNLAGRNDHRGRQNRRTLDEVVLFLINSGTLILCSSNLLSSLQMRSNRIVRHILRPQENGTERKHTYNNDRQLPAALENLAKDTMVFIVKISDATDDITNTKYESNDMHFQFSSRPINISSIATKVRFFFSLLW